MKAISFGELKYSEWKKVDEYTFERSCLTQSLKIYTAKIKLENRKYSCEVPMKLPLRLVDDSKKFIIKNIEHFDNIISCVVWIDTYLSKELKADVEKPFIFKW